ncbi:hypothetical protein DFP72DRAFT_917033 [Ephemerocybe angulata]|uniref:F-box domain-containing protein n=1 Tax=Ephemerocybe angulata TaxID=980116 RepID=A0A8H6HMB0_9AGAR|nr:hypothetical protein DFP72DRAFT_917033 [Tulosesus angulatus]
MASPFTSILKTNHVPSDLERKAIEQFLEGPELESSNLSAEIDRYEAIIQALRTKRDLLRPIIDDHRAILSPARRLPDDILREVFVRCLPHKHNATMYAGDAPVLLCHVCSRWRKLALATPTLWSSLHVSTFVDDYDLAGEGSDVEEMLNERDERVKNWIARSGALPLSLSFRPADEQYPSDHTCGDLRRVLSILAPTFERWSDIDMLCVGKPDEVATMFDIPEWEHRSPFLAAQKVRLRLDTTYPRKGWTVSNEEIATVLRGFGFDRNKTLTNLSLYPYNSESRALRAATPVVTQYPFFSNLQVLRLQDPSDQEDWPPRIMYDQKTIFDIIRQCPLLAIFDANVDIKNSLDGLEVGSKVVHKNLQHLSFMFSIMHGPFFANLCRLCEWPAMKFLRLRTWQDYTWTQESVDRLDALPPLIEATVGQSLTSLTLNSGFWVIGSLPNFPNLVQLHLNHYRNDSLHREPAFYDSLGMVPHNRTTSGILASLTPSVDGQTTHSCPLLQYLKWESLACFSNDDLCDFLHARATSLYSPRPMKQVCINFNFGRETDSILEKCSALIKDGLYLQLAHTRRKKTPAPIPTPLVAKAGLALRQNDFELGWCEV